MKEQHLTTCVHGHAAEAGHRIVFYRSHLGSAGNLLDELLASRKPSSGEVKIVADLSSSNLPRDQKLHQMFKITMAGCAAHARRPFFRYARHDHEVCLELLDYFTYLFKIEDIIRADSPEIRKQLRSDARIGSAFAWNEIKRCCTRLQDKYSESTPLGRGARYVLKNATALEQYLSDPELPASNNQTERLLRFEKLNERGTYGCKTIEGRARMDVLRTILTTARFSGIDEHIYLMKILITPQEKILANPENYTPSIIKKHFESNLEDEKLVRDLLQSSDYGKFVKPTSNFQRQFAQDC